MTKSRNINAPRYEWQPWQDDVLRCVYECTANEALIKVLGATRKQIYSRAQFLGLKKGKWFFKNHPTSSTLVVTSRNRSALFRFKKGNVPHNKGRKGIYAPGSEKGWFAKGTTPHNTRVIGHLRKTKDGYYEVKISNTGIKNTDWRPVHRLVWERCNGRAVPAKHVVIYLNPDYENYDIKNLALISKAENARRNSIHNFGPEIARNYQLIGAITRQINKRKNQNDTI